MATLIGVAAAETPAASHAAMPATTAATSAVRPLRRIPSFIESLLLELSCFSDVLRTGSFVILPSRRSRSAARPTALRRLYGRADARRQPLERLLTRLPDPHQPAGREQDDDEEDCADDRVEGALDGRYLHVADIVVDD